MPTFAARLVATLFLSSLSLVAARAWGDDAAAAWTVPRTSYGAPDLEGIWTNATITTLERPDGIDSLLLTPEEAERLERERADFYSDYDQPTAAQDEALPAGEDPGGYNTFWMDEGQKLAVVRGEIRSSLIVDPEDGEIPYRLWARLEMLVRFSRFMSVDDPEQRPLGERCIVGFGSTGGPPMLPVLYNNNYQIVQTPDHVAIIVEMNHDARIVRIGGEHPAPHVRTWLGDSVGHWEGDTLVVETTNFHPGQDLRVAIKHALYTSENLMVVERFTRVSPDEMLYGFTMHDPEIYSQPWRAEIPMRRAPGPLYEYACHEGNYALPNILAGARAEERDEAASSWWRTLASRFGG